MNCRLSYCSRRRLCAVEREAKKLRDMEGRRNPDFKQERSCGPALKVSVPRRQRRSMCHMRDGVGFDKLIAGVVEPHLTGIVFDPQFLRRRVRQSMNVDPLFDDLARV